MIKWFQSVFFSNDPIWPALDGGFGGIIWNYPQVALFQVGGSFELFQMTGWYVPCEELDLINPLIGGWSVDHSDFSR